MSSSRVLIGTQKFQIMKLKLHIICSILYAKKMQSMISTNLFTEKICHVSKFLEVKQGEIADKKSK